MHKVLKVKFEMFKILFQHKQALMTNQFSGIESSLSNRKEEIFA